MQGLRIKGIQDKEVVRKECDPESIENISVQPEKREQSFRLNYDDRQNQNSKSKEQCLYRQPGDRVARETDASERHNGSSKAILPYDGTYGRIVCFQRGAIAPVIGLKRGEPV